MVKKLKYKYLQLQKILTLASKFRLCESLARISHFEIYVVDHLLNSGNEAVTHVIGGAVLETLLAMRVRAQPQQRRQRGRRVR